MIARALEIQAEARRARRPISLSDAMLRALEERPAAPSATDATSKRCICDGERRCALHTRAIDRVLVRASDEELAAWEEVVADPSERAAGIMLLRDDGAAGGSFTLGGEQDREELLAAIRAERERRASHV